MQTSSLMPDVSFKAKSFLKAQIMNVCNIHVEYQYIAVSIIDNVDYITQQYKYQLHSYPFPYTTKICNAMYKGFSFFSCRIRSSSMSPYSQSW